MKRRIDIERAAEAEVAGALAGPQRTKREVQRGEVGGRTVAQHKALEELLVSLMDFARKSGARSRTVKFGNISLKLRSQGADDVLSIHRLADA
jgi:hypothetical protein